MPCTARCHGHDAAMRRAIMAGRRWQRVHAVVDALDALDGPSANNAPFAFPAARHRPVVSP